MAFLRGCIDSELTRRAVPGGGPPGPRKLVKHIIPFYLSVLMDCLRLSHHACTEEAISLLPPGMQHVRPRFVHRYRPIGRRWCGYYAFFGGATFSYQQLVELSASPCNYHNCAPIFKHHGCAHVVTASPLFLHYHLGNVPNLAKLFSLGAKYRPHQFTIATADHKLQVLAHVTSAIYRAVHKWSESFSLAPSMLQPYATYLIHSVGQEMLSIPDDFCFVPREVPVSGRREIEAIRRLHQDFVITYIDKAANNMVWVCKVHVKQQVWC